MSPLFRVYRWITSNRAMWQLIGVCNYKLGRVVERDNIGDNLYSLQKITTATRNGDEDDTDGAMMI